MQRNLEPSGNSLYGKKGQSIWIIVFLLFLSAFLPMGSAGCRSDKAAAAANTTILLSMSYGGIFTTSLGSQSVSQIQTPDRLHAYLACWAPDRRSIVFAGGLDETNQKRGNSECGIWRVASNNTSCHLIARLNVHGNLFWRPDGSGLLAVARTGSSDISDDALFSVDLSGSIERIGTAGLPSESLTALSLSPDGNMVAYPAATADRLIVNSFDGNGIREQIASTDLAPLLPGSASTASSFLRPVWISNTELIVPEPNRVVIHKEDGSTIQGAKVASTTLWKWNITTGSKTIVKKSQMWEAFYGLSAAPGKRSIALLSIATEHILTPEELASGEAPKIKVLELERGKLSVVRGVPLSKGGIATSLNWSSP